MSMSAQSPWLQFAIGLPDSPKSEAKGAILDRGPWDETLGSLDLPFDVNHRMSFLSVYTEQGLPTDVYYIHLFMQHCSVLWVICAGRSRRGKTGAIGWRKPVLKKSKGCWIFPSRSGIKKSL